jgi:ADP-ribose pyrophosphatase YjhB (NUDIX family)
VAAVVRRGSDLLLVEQQGADDPQSSWALPGGSVEEGESLTDALARELREETGLNISEPDHLVYVSQIESVAGSLRSAGELPRPSERATVFVFEVRPTPGELRAEDPDRLVRTAAWVTPAQALQRLGDLPWRSMREPLIAYLQGEAVPGALWLYRRDEAGEDQLLSRIALDLRGPGRRRGVKTPFPMPGDPNRSPEQARQQSAIVLGCLAVVAFVVIIVIIGIIASVG